MRRLSLSGWKDPASRPRYILLMGVVLLALATFVVVSTTVTSSYWFCSSVCHQVMDDAILAYNASSHSDVTCYACHAKVESDPVSFLLHKVEFGLDGAYKVAVNEYPVPPNAESHLALETPEEQCTQCHSDGRSITPSAGMVIDHAIHREEGIGCTTCHNRVAHREEGELVLAGSKKHADFMEMQGCFRCHGLSKGARAPGECSLCHTPSFDLVPASHDSTRFYTPFGDSGGHARLALEDARRLETAKESSEKQASEEPAHAEKEGDSLPSIHSVPYCGQCHEEGFCDDCHGMEMPHLPAFKDDHAETAASNPRSCVKCHASSAKTGDASDLCSDCHHSMGDTSRNWFPQHPSEARKDSAACMGCHTTMYCETCHVSGEPEGDH